MAKVHELPDRETADGLTTRQRRVLEVIRNSVDRRGYPPSLREIGEAVGLQSPSSVSYQLLALERKGFLRKDPNRPRAIEVLSPGTDPSSDSGARGYRQSHADVVDETGSGDSRPTPAYVPVLGQIAAGVPITAEEVVDDVFALPRQIVGEGELFLLKVVGDSMVEAAICDGDWVVVRQQATADNGDIVAAMLDNEATVKTFKCEGPRVAHAPERGFLTDRRRPRHDPGQSHRRTPQDLNLAQPALCSLQTAFGAQNRPRERPEASKPQLGPQLSLNVAHDPAQGDPQRRVEADRRLVVATARPARDDCHRHSVRSRSAHEPVAAHHLQRGAHDEKSRRGLNLRKALLDKGFRHRLAKEDDIGFDQVRLTDQTAGRMKAGDRIVR